MKSTFIVAAFTVTSLAAFSSSAQQLYITNEGHADIQLLNLNTSALSVIYTIGVGKDFNPDDLTLNAAGQLIYSVPVTGNVNLYDPKAGTNTLLTNVRGARDLEIEPGGATMLIAGNAAPAEIVRYTFATGQTSVLFPKTKGITNMNGISYDNFGNLYAIMNRNTVVQLNPTTGAVISTLVLEPLDGVNGGDGLTFDTYTGALWASHDGKNLGTGLIEIPVQASGFTPSGYYFYPLPAIGNVDGIKSDGKGNLYVAAIHTTLEYNIPTQKMTRNLVTDGADGVSLVPGTY
jgi:streptogramin lyase